MAYDKAMYDAQRHLFLLFLGNKCRKCQSKDNLEFDHIDPDLKTMKMSPPFGKKSIVAALAELIGKCQILCNRCHVEKSRGEQRIRRRRPVNHGTIYAWMKIKCGCETCSAAKWGWHDERNRRRLELRGEKARGPYHKTRNTGNVVVDNGPRPSRQAD